ncbi:hypothetical protein [Streptomyces sp. WAC 06783]|uniref:hypothetical protein n=1 Tax=Streptomyces sp. WAC 06783 TaxID=2203211 RepID=UPI00163C03D1|nr:hypothetical protein [Streptomyces sp. WAC 06783]
MNIDHENATLLAVQPNLAVLRRRRMTWTAGGDLADCAAFHIKPGVVHFYVEHIAE